MAARYHINSSFTIIQLIHILDESQGYEINLDDVGDIQQVLGRIEHCYSNEYENDGVTNLGDAEDAINQRINLLKQATHPLSMPVSSYERYIYWLIDRGEIYRIQGSIANVWNVTDMKTVRRVYRTHTGIIGFIGPYTGDTILWVETEYLEQNRAKDYNLIREYLSIK